MASGLWVHTDAERVVPTRRPARRTVLSPDRSLAGCGADGIVYDDPLLFSISGK